MTINAIMAVILRYYTKLDKFRGHYAKVVNDRPILFATKI